MGIESNIKNKFLSTLLNDEGWKELLTSIFGVADFENIFKYYTFNGVPLTIKFNGDSVSRGYLTVQIADAEFIVNIEISDVRLSINPPFTLLTGPQEGSEVYYSGPSEPLHLYLNGGTLSDVVLSIESSANGVIQEIIDLLSDDSYFLKNTLRLTTEGESSLYLMFKELVRRRNIPIFTQKYNDSTTGSRTVIFENLIDLYTDSASGIKYVKNPDIILTKYDSVFSASIGGVYEKYTLSFSTTPLKSGILKITLDGVLYQIYIDHTLGLSGILNSIANSSVFPLFNLFLVGSTVTFIYKTLGPLLGPFGVEELLDCRELDTLTIGSATTFSGTIHIILNGVNKNINLVAGLSPQLIAAQIGQVVFPGWTAKDVGNKVLFLRNTAGIVIPPQVIDYGSQASFIVAIQYAMNPIDEYFSITVDNITHIIYLDINSINLAFPSGPSNMARVAQYIRLQFNLLNLGWVCVNTAPGIMIFTKTNPGIAPQSYVMNLGNRENVEFSFGNLVLRPSTFQIVLDGTPYSFDISATDTRNALAIRMVNDVRLLPNWTIKRVGYMGNLTDGTILTIQYRRRTLVSCLPPVAPTAGTFHVYTFGVYVSNGTYSGQSTFKAWLIGEPGVSPTMQYSVTINTGSTSTSASVRSSLISALNTNGSFSSHWKASVGANIPGSPYYIIKITRKTSGSSWITNGNYTFGLLLSQNIQIHTNTPVAPVLGTDGSFESASFTRLEGNIPRPDYANVADEQPGQAGCTPSIVATVVGSVGLAPTLVKNYSGSYGTRFKYPILGHQSNVIVIGNSLTPTLTIDYLGTPTVYSASAYVPTNGRYAVEKGNYQVTVDKTKELVSELLIETQEETKEIVNSMLPARVKGILE